MPEWVMQLVVTGGAAVGIYTGIRADLARLHERVETATSFANRASREANRAHDRIDDILGQSLK